MGTREVSRAGHKKLTKILFHCDRETLHRPIEALEVPEESYPPPPPAPSDADDDHGDPPPPPLPPLTAAPGGDDAWEPPPLGAPSHGNGADKGGDGSGGQPPKPPNKTHAIGFRHESCEVLVSFFSDHLSVRHRSMGNGQWSRVSLLVRELF